MLKLINSEVSVALAQLKSYTPEVDLQLEMFQVAEPLLVIFLVWTMFLLGSVRLALKD